MSERFVHRLRVRYNECDVQGIVFNANFLVYFDVALNELLRRALGSYRTLHEAGLDMLVLEATVRYRAPARFEDELDVALVPEPLGRSSMVCHAAITRDDAPVAEGRLVHVFADLATQQKCEIPDWVRAKLDPWTATPERER